MILYQLRYDDGTTGDRVYKSYKKAEEEIRSRGYINLKTSMREGRNYPVVSKKYYKDKGDDYMYVEEISLDKLRVIATLNKSTRRYNRKVRIRQTIERYIKKMERYIKNKVR